MHQYLCEWPSVALVGTSALVTCRRPLNHSLLCLAACVLAGAKLVCQWMTAPSSSWTRGWPPTYQRLSSRSSQSLRTALGTPRPTYRGKRRTNVCRLPPPVRSCLSICQGTFPAFACILLAACTWAVRGVGKRCPDYRTAPLIWFNRQDNDPTNECTEALFSLCGAPPKMPLNQTQVDACANCAGDKQPEVEAANCTAPDVKAYSTPAAEGNLA